MREGKFKIGDMVCHKDGTGLTYEVIGTAYDLGWITLREKLPFGGAEPWPCTNYDDFEIVNRLQYETDKYGWSKLQCPHADFLLRVGSQVCRKCQYHLKQNMRQGYVDCFCPEGEMLKTLPGETILEH